MNIQNTLNEAANHMKYVSEVWSDEFIELSVLDIDEHIERFVRTFFPEHYGEIFDGN